MTEFKWEKGDVIIFKAGDDWLSKAIAWFTGSNVSHSAMVYSQDSIVEAGASGIGVHKTDLSQGEEVYILRLETAPDPSFLIASADRYLKAGTRYDFPALFLLAGLLIFRKIVPSGRLCNIALKILETAVLQLDAMLNDAIYHSGERAMVCSQLVYQIFYDCGGEYRIQIKDGCLDCNAALSGASDTVRLIDYIDCSVKDTPSVSVSEEAICKISSERSNLPADSLKKAFPELSPDSPDFRELYEALLESVSLHKASAGVNNCGGYTDALLAPAADFVSRLQKLLSLTHCDIPLDALFVTPGDLMYHAANLEQKGTLLLTRIH